MSSIGDVVVLMLWGVDLETFSSSQVQKCLSFCLEGEKNPENVRAVVTEKILRSIFNNQEVHMMKELTEYLDYKNKKK